MFIMTDNRVGLGITRILTMKTENVPAEEHRKSLLGSRKRPKRKIGQEDDHLERLADFASLYFEERLSQNDIALRTGYSRSMVSRLLTEARQQGLIEIRVRRPLERRMDLERELSDALGLEIVRVAMCGTTDYPKLLRRLGSVAARLVEELTHDDMTVGVSWGTAVYETVNSLKSGRHSGIHVLQMIGSLGTPDPHIDGPELARVMARTWIGRYTVLPVPLLVDSPTTRQVLIKDPSIERVIAQFPNIELALVGVGTVEPEQASLLRAGYLSLAQLEELRQAGVVGDVCAIQFDLSGRLVDVPLTRRIVGIEPSTLTKIPKKIGVAGGKHKVLPIIGASRSGLINILVTDELTASNILHAIRGDGNRTNE